MARVRTNEVGLAVAIEGKAVGNVLTPDDRATPAYQRKTGDEWFGLEPNTIGNLGAQLSNVTRQPLSAGRQRQKGRIVDLDSSVDFESDLTVDVIDRFIEGLLFAKATNRDLYWRPSGVAAAGYTIPAVSAAQATRLKTGALVMAYGFSNAANNGLRRVNADVAAAAVSLTARKIGAAANDLVAEAIAADAKRRPIVRYAGQTLIDAAKYDWDKDTKRLTISAIVGAQNWGLTVGQMVHIGSTDGSDGVANAPKADYYGYARVAEIPAAGTSLVLKDVASALQENVAADASAVAALMFGEFIRNVASNHTSYVERSYAFEALFAGLDGTGDDKRNYEYPQGNITNQITLNLPLTDKATVGFAFVGLDTPKPQTRRKQADGKTDLSAHNPYTPIMNEIFNTSADMARLRVAKVDGDGITTDFKSATFTLNNNATPDKVLGTLGAKDFDYGTFEAQIQTQMVFTDPLVLDSIRDNVDVSIEIAVVNDEAALVFELPRCTINSAGREYPLNRSVLLNTPVEAFAGDAGYTVGVSVIPGAPNVAREVGQSF